MKKDELLQKVKANPNLEYSPFQETDCTGNLSIDIKVKERELQSRCFNEKMHYTVICPPNYSDKKSYPVLYLFHGMDATHRAWIEDVKIVNTYKRLLAQELICEMLIICVDSGFNGKSYYINSATDPQKQYEDYFIKELMPTVEKEYSVDATAAGRGVSGFSMGGMGAFRFGLKYPHLFNKISSLAGLLNLARRVSHKREFGFRRFLTVPTFSVKDDNFRLFLKFFGRKIGGWELLNPYGLLKKCCKEQRELLREKAFYIDVGENDAEMLPEFVDILYLLEKYDLNYQAKVIENEGHDWEYVRRNIHKILLFHQGK